MAERIRNPEELETWLQDKPREWAQLIALRSSLRALPGIAAKGTSDRLRLAVFRAVVVAWAVQKLPANNISSISPVAAAAVDSIAGQVGDHSLAANIAADAAAGAAAAAVEDRRPAPYAAGAAEDVADLAGDTDAIWAEVDADIAMLESGAAGRLISAPLWSGSEPEPIEALRLHLFPEMMAHDPNAGIWRDWYHRRLLGADNGFGLDRIEDETILIRLLIEEEPFWDRDPRAVNASIAGWIETVQRETPQLRETQVAVDFFISYAAPDEAMAREIVTILDSEGLSSVAQFRDFVPGSNFVREMQRGLASSARLIALLSPAYEESDHCQAEWSAAYSEDPGGREGKILPLLIAPTHLNPLARSIVYRSLVGLSVAERRAAVIEAVGSPAPRRTTTEIRREAAQLASPDVRVIEGRLDIARNPRLDRPDREGSIEDLIEILRTLAQRIAGDLSSNASRSLKSAADEYSNHLSRFGERPIVGLLDDLEIVLRAAFEGTDPREWNPGFPVLLQRFFERHDQLKRHFPQFEERDRFIEALPIDEARAQGAALTEPVAALAEAVSALSKAGLTTVAFDANAQREVEEAGELSHVFTAEEEEEEDEEGPDAGDAPRKRRFVAQLIGFYERTLAALSSSAQLVDSPAAQSAVRAIGEAIRKLLSLLRL